MKNKLALFDLDGTLFDTRRVNFCAYQKALEEYNICLDYDYFSDKCNGKHYLDFLPLIMGDDIYIQQVHKNKKAYYSLYLNESIINKHLFELISSIKETYYIGLVTTASRKNTEDILNYYDKSDEFDLIISQEDVNKKKPNPEGFLKAMKYFNISPQDTFIFEDSDVGIEAAQKTGATVFVAKGFA